MPYSRHYYSFIIPGNPIERKEKDLPQTGLIIRALLGQYIVAQEIFEGFTQDNYPRFSIGDKYDSRLEIPVIVAGHAIVVSASGTHGENVTRLR